MTCVVGMAEGGKVWMGCDSATSWEDDTARTQIARNPKVFRVGALLIGSCGSGRVQNIVRAMSVPKRHRGVSAFDYIAVTVAAAVRRALQDAGALTRDHDGAPEVMPGGSSLLIGYRSGLYRMDEDFSVDEAADDQDGVGVGASWALGLLQGTGGDPKKRILDALRFAEKNCWAVRRPFRVEML
jgi:hypothetical protein